MKCGLGWGELNSNFKGSIESFDSLYWDSKDFLFFFCLFNYSIFPASPGWPTPSIRPTKVQSYEVRDVRDARFPAIRYFSPIFFGSLLFFFIIFHIIIFQTVCTLKKFL